MRPRHVALILNAVAYFASPATAQSSTPRTHESPLPQHTAIYTTTLANEEPPRITTTVVVTLLMPRELPHYPKDGSPVTGTAISHLSAAQADGAVSTWAATTELFWTLSGNSPLRVESTITLPAQSATTTLTSVYTTTDYHSSEIRGIWISMARYEWFTTSRVTFIEAVGTAYPATIIRTGYTHMEATMRGGNVAVTSTYSETGTVSLWRTTTMVQVAARPTPWR
ncbi:hypothetical protein MFIFM68171_11210 [Madurella fahalii]|uniref:Uncharacterized protein n=1 Tax=Madurella fahalii TaxID=1157608 RepID=A0ABQ0GTE5_9PEZI